MERRAGRPAERRRFGYMPEERGLYPGMLVGEQVEYLGRLHGLSAATTPRRRHGPGSSGSTSPTGPTSKVETLSHGNQQRVQLAAALVHDPELLVLDEPLAGLDPTGIDAISQVLVDQARAGCCVLFSSHQLDLVEDLCEQVTIIDHGRLVVSGTVDELATSGARRLVVRVEGDRTADWARACPASRSRRSTAGAARLVLDDDGRQRRRAAGRHGGRAGHRVLLRAPPALRGVPGGAGVRLVLIAVIVAVAVAAARPRCRRRQTKAADGVESP